MRALDCAGIVGIVGILEIERIWLITGQWRLFSRPILDICKRSLSSLPMPRRLFLVARGP